MIAKVRMRLGDSKVLFDYPGARRHRNRCSLDSERMVRVPDSITQVPEFPHGTDVGIARGRGIRRHALQQCQTRVMSQVLPNIAQFPAR